MLAITPVMIIEMIMAGPARLAATPVTTKIPAPMIAPTPIAVALKKPISRFNTISLRNMTTQPELPFSENSARLLKR